MADIAAAGLTDLQAAALVLEIEERASFIASRPERPTAGQASAAYAKAASKAHEFALELAELPQSTPVIRSAFEKRYGKGSLRKFDEQLRQLRGLLRKLAKEPESTYITAPDSELIVRLLAEDFQRLTGMPAANTANLYGDERHVPSAFVTCVRAALFLTERRWRTPEAVSQLISRI